MSEVLSPSNHDATRSAGPPGLDRYQAFFNASPNGILILEDTGTILEANEAAVSLTGYPASSLTGQRILGLLDPESWEAANQSFLKAQFSRNSLAEVVVRRADGTTFPAEIVWNRLMIDGRMLFHGTLSNISERHRVLAESRQAREEAERANAARLLFLATMSHEIRTPLNGIIGFTDLLAQSELPREQRQYVDMVRRSSDILLRIIDDILNLSRIESGRIELEEIDFEPETCIEEVLALHANSKTLATVELLHEVLDGVPAMVRGDAARIRQILINLVSNALKFTSRGHVLVRCGVQDNRFLAFSVRDTGVGFDPAKMESLFEPFFQEDASTTRRYGGTGLGLSICRKLVQRMGGYIEARSQPGQGAEFWFGVPLLPSAQAPAPATDPPLTGKRALLVAAPEPANRIYRQRLARTGMECQAEPDPSSALSLAKHSAFDLILFVGDPESLPIEALARKLARTKPNRNAKLVLIANTPTARERGPEADSPFDAILTPPVRQSILQDSLLSLLRPVPTAPPPIPQQDTPINRPTATVGAEAPFLLIAEDNHINAQLALLVAQRLGFQAHVASTGREALDYLVSGQQYAAVLMDMRMPEMDGLEAARRIRFGQLGFPISQVPIYALTANAMSSDREACLQAGMNGYFTKPLRVEELAQTFREAGLLPGA